MGKHLNSCPCCGIINTPSYDCCFYSERQDPDRLYVTIPPLGWDTYSHAKTYDPTRYHDREGFFTAEGGLYLDPHFENGVTVECNWINDLSQPNCGLCCRTELCNVNPARGVNSIISADRYYVSDLIIGDVNEAYTVVEQALADEEIPLIYVTAYFILVKIGRTPLQLPPFGTTNLYSDGCYVSIEFVSYNYGFENAFFWFDPNARRTVAEATEEITCYYDTIINYLDYFPNFQGATLECQSTEGDYSNVAPFGGLFGFGGSLETCRLPTWHSLINGAGFASPGEGPVVHGGTLCYGYLPSRTVDPTLNNRFIPLYTFDDLYDTPTRQYYHSFINGTKDDFSITW